jgi:hypothetical protein
MSELSSSERDEQYRLDITARLLDNLTALMSVVKLEIMADAPVLSTQKQMRYSMQERLAHLQRELNFTLRSLHASTAPSQSTEQESHGYFSATHTETLAE